MDKGNAWVTGSVSGWTLALREWQWLFVPFAVWVVVTVLATLAGPFETYEGLTVLPRLAYWAVVVGVSVLLDLGFRRVLRDGSMARRLVARLGYAVALALLIHGINRVVFPGWMGWHMLGWLIGIVWAVAIAVEGLVALARQATPSINDENAATPEHVAPDTVFQQRLPHDKRGALIRLEAQDHYLAVVTTSGEALILMRMSDAETELAGFDGLRVHRSHWIAVGQVQEVSRTGGRLSLRMSDGCDVPVSRSFRAGVNAAGLLA
jgi:hypothetical protein